MAVKKLQEVLAAMGGDVTVAERTARLYTEIEALGDDAPDVNIGGVLRSQVRRSLDLVLNLQLDMAAELSLLPEGKDKAMEEMHDALDFVEAYAIYENMEEADGDK